MNTKHLALVRALSVDLLPALRARALNPHTTENTRPFGRNPSGGHLYIGRRIRSPGGERKWETYGPPAEVLEILDLLDGEKKKADIDSSTAIPDVVAVTPPFPRLVNVHAPADVGGLTPTAPDESFDQATRPLTTPWAVAMMLVVLAPCLLYLTAILSSAIKTSGRPAMIAPPARSSGSLDQPYLRQKLGAQVSETPLVKTVKDTGGVESNKEPVTNTTSHGGDLRPSDKLAEIGRDMQALETKGSRIHRLGLFFKAVEASAGVDGRKLRFSDDVPLASGQIVEVSGQKLFDQLGQIPAALPRAFRLVWESPTNSAVAAELRDSLTSCVTAVAIQRDLLNDQLVLRTQSQRLADAFRAAYGVPAGVTTWRDPGSGWIFTIVGTCLVIRE